MSLGSTYIRGEQWECVPSRHVGGGKCKSAHAHLLLPDCSHPHLNQLVSMYVSAASSKGAWNWQGTKVPHGCAIYLILGMRPGASPPAASSRTL